MIKNILFGTVLFFGIIGLFLIWGNKPGLVVLFVIFLFAAVLIYFPERYLSLLGKLDLGDFDFKPDVSIPSTSKTPVKPEKILPVNPMDQVKNRSQSGSAPGVQVPGSPPPSAPRTRDSGAVVLTKGKVEPQSQTLPAIEEMIKSLASMGEEKKPEFPLANKVIEEICKFLSISEGQIYLISRGQPDYLEFLSTFPASGASSKKPRIKWKETPFESVIVEGSQFIPGGAGAGPLLNLPPIVSMACTPVLLGTKVIGILNIEKFPQPINQLNAMLFFLFGQIAGNFLAFYKEVDVRESEIVDLKKEINKLAIQVKRLESTTNFLDQEVDRQYFQNLDLEKQRAYILSSFQKFLSPIIIEKIVQDPNSLKPGGVKQVVTVFFSDIRNFTRMSEKMDPSQIVELLNDYYSAMTPIILKYHGLFDKYIGDEIMALFGAPLSFPDAPIRAVFCGMEMQKTLEGLKGKWREKNFPLFDFGIGINTGEVTVGFLGSENAFAYTAIGDSVNLAARLCAIAPPQKMLISHETAKELGEFVYLKEIPAVMVKGKELPVKVFEVAGLAKLPPFVPSDLFPEGLPPQPAGTILAGSLR